MGTWADTKVGRSTLPCATTQLTGNICDREFIEQSWFIASVSILPSALVAIPFGAVVALQTGSLIKQLGAESFTGATSVLAVIQQGSPLVTALLVAGAA